MKTQFASGIKISTAAILLILTACGKNQQKTTSSDSLITTPPEESELAQHDIAMTIRSMASSIEAGEALDSSAYNFTGCLTDGRGVPLYTDFNNRPGKWRVEVKSPTKATIRSLYPGDLFPEDLRLYILSALSLTEEDVDSLYVDNDAADSESFIYYDFGPGLLRFQTYATEAPDGSESSLLDIEISRREG